MAESMDDRKSESDRIKDLLKSNPRGMSVTDIARELKISRNTTAKYLEILRISGYVDMESIGTAKVYYLSHRIPVSTLLNFSSEYIMVIDSYLQVIQVNKKFLDLLNMEKNDVVGQKADRVLLPLFRDVDISARMSEAIRGEEQKDRVHFSSAGRECYLHTKIIPSTFDNGEQGATIILEDITEEMYSHNSLVEQRSRLEELIRKRTCELEDLNRSLKREIAEKEKAEKLLRESEERYKRLYMNSPLGYQVMDREGILLEVSKEWLHTLGYAREEVVGQPFESFLRGTNISKETVREILQGEHNNTVHSYFQVAKKDGSTIVASFSCNRAHKGLTESDRVQCIMRDVTQHRQFGEKVLENEKKLNTILNSLPDGILMVDPENHEIVYVNTAACDILGDRKEHIIGKKRSDYICDASHEKSPAICNGYEGQSLSCMLVRSDGRTVPVEKTVVQVELEGKKNYVEIFTLDDQ